jgi:hypothetical protein
MINGPVVETILVDVHYAELLFYQETENLLPPQFRRHLSCRMLSQVSTNPFIACVRVYPSTPGQTHRCLKTDTGWIEYELLTTSSLPLSPSARHACVHLRVVHTLQTARDQLISFSELSEETAD